MPDDLEDVMEEEILAAQEEKLQDVKTSRIDGAGEKSKFVTQNAPEEKTNYKDRLTKVYDDLKNVNVNNLEEELDLIKEELAKIIDELEESDLRIQKLVENKIDCSIKDEPSDLYEKKTRKNIIKLGDEKVFTPTNVLLFLGIVAVMVLAGAIFTSV